MGIIEKLKVEKAALMTILVFTGLSLILILYTFFLYFAVGARWHQFWFYGAVQDVPGQSYYSTSAPNQFFPNETSPSVRGGRVAGQHVMEDHRDPLFVPGIPQVIKDKPEAAEPQKLKPGNGAPE